MFRYSFFIIVCATLISCGISKKIGSIRMEIMQPAEFTIPGNPKSVEIINCDFKTGSHCPVMKLINGALDIRYIKNQNLSFICIDAISEYLRENGSFQDINCCYDSLAQLKTIEKLDSRAFFENRTSDLCIFLDSLKFQRIFNDRMQEFDQIKATFSWIAKYKTDSLVSYFLKNDSLILTDVDNSFYLSDKYFYPYRDIYRYCKEIGEYIGSQIIPTWQPEERMYYKSRNAEMLKAEKFAKNNDWRNAAEIWNKMTRNGNRVMTAKACFNMALACEMEGNLEAANDWVVQSYLKLKKNDRNQREDCRRYISMLASRKKEIEKLSKQVANN